MVIERRKLHGPRNTEVFTGVPHSDGTKIGEKVIIMEDTPVTDASQRASQVLRADLRKIWELKKGPDGTAKISALVTMATTEVTAFRSQEKGANTHTTLIGGAFSIGLTAFDDKGTLAIKGGKDFDPKLKASLEGHGIPVKK